MPALTGTRRGLPAGLAALLLLSATTAGAQPAGEPDAQRKAQASAHLKRGAERIDADDLAGALAEFEAAYRLVPSPAIFHNFGIVYQGLGRKAAALDAFQRFLEQADRPPPGTRQHAQQAVQALRAEVAELRVESDVIGATIFVDGRRVGETPQRQPIYLDPGPHHLSIEQAGGGSLHAERLELRAGQQLTVSARPAATPLVPAPAPTAQVDRPAAPSPATDWQRPAAWAAAAAATVATAAFATAVVVRHRKFSDHNDTGCGADDPQPYHGDCPKLLQDGRRAEKWARATGIAAGALAVGAAVLFWTAPDRPVDVALSASPSNLGLALQGRF